VLGHARAEGVDAGALPAWLGEVEGGIKAVVAAARAAKRPAPKPQATPDLQPIARVAIPYAGAPGELVVLVARVVEGGVEVLGVASDPKLAERAARAVARG
jgi:hypothetical protein